MINFAKKQTTKQLVIKKMMSKQIVMAVSKSVETSSRKTRATKGSSEKKYRLLIKLSKQR
jgi:hypothetical protein